MFLDMFGEHDGDDDDMFLDADDEGLEGIELDLYERLTWAARAAFFIGSASAAWFHIKDNERARNRSAIVGAVGGIAEIFVNAKRKEARDEESAARMAAMRTARAAR